ncbi:MAG: terminase small subunit [Methylococcales bacterium]
MLSHEIIKWYGNPFPDEIQYCHECRNLTRKTHQLTSRQMAFCECYAVLGNATRAAKCAYSPRTTYNRGWKLLRKPWIIAHVHRCESKGVSFLKIKTLIFKGWN